MYSAKTKLIGALLLLAAAAAFAAPMLASAHVTGSSWQVPAGKYFADVGYDPVAFTAGFYTRFDFNLKKTASTTDLTDNIPFDEVWVRVKDANNTYLATGIRKEPIGPTTLLYLFANPGQYTLDASFRDTDGNEIAAAEFPITVAADSPAGFLYGSTLYAALVFGGIVLGVVLTILFSIVRKVRRS